MTLMTSRSCVDHEEFARPSETAGGRVVVGVDGSADSVAALSWAVTLAARRGWLVEVVAAWPEPSAVFIHEVPGHFCVPRHQAMEAIRSAIEETSSQVDSLPPIVTHVANAHPVEALLERASGASLLVLGVGSGAAHRRDAVAQTCGLLAECPVALIGSR